MVTWFETNISDNIESIWYFFWGSRSYQPIDVTIIFPKALRDGAMKASHGTIKASQQTLNDTVTSAVYLQ